jgi:hypothetical protein
MLMSRWRAYKRIVVQNDMAVRPGYVLSSVGIDWSLVARVFLEYALLS